VPKILTVLGFFILVVNVGVEIVVNVKLFLILNQISKIFFDVVKVYQFFNLLFSQIRIHCVLLTLMGQSRGE
jgi:hypothetical protein